MSTPTSDAVLTVAQMRAAEQALIAGGESVETLMERAGAGVADWVWRVAAGRPVTVLCGPGNNGGDGYVVARELMRRGLPVTVVAPVEPRTKAAIAARQAYEGPIEPQGHGGVLVDCLFGSGLARPLAPELTALLRSEAERHAYLLAVDVPSGIDSDRAVALNEGLPHLDLTLALGAWKPAHWLMPAMTGMGERRLVPIGVEPAERFASLLARPAFTAPAPDAHKYTRGLVLVVGGAMPGAALLACESAMRAGAGAVRLAVHDLPPGSPPDLVLKPEPLEQLLGDPRNGAVLAGPGLGRTAAARDRLQAVLQANAATVLDADALVLFTPSMLGRFGGQLVLTPHEGELQHLLDSFGLEGAGKVESATALAQATGGVVIAKGPDTVIAAPDRRVALAPSPTAWLSVAGTGDVLAGAVASRVACGSDGFTAACEAVWLHGEAARHLSAPFLASGLAQAISRAYASAL